MRQRALDLCRCRFRAGAGRRTCRRRRPAADADRVPWARFQSRIAVGARRAAAGAPTWRRSSAAACRSAALGLLGDVYFGAAPAPGTSAGGFRATSGVLIGARSPGSPASAPTGGLLRDDRRLFGASPRRSTHRPIRRRQRDRALHRHRLQQPRRPRAAGASAPIWASSRRAPATSSASGASSAARRASTTSSATCAWRRSSSSASRIPSEPLARRLPVQSA